MAKKIKKVKKVKKTEVPENQLPQNILAVGERVEENKHIYISQAVYKEIHKFTQNKTTDESGGMLVGTTIEEFGKTNIVISGFVEAKYCEATPTTLKFTHETWEYVHKEIEKKHKGKKIVGWIHTHPDFGIFLSEYDRFIHQNFFSDDNQVAYVVDPIQNIEGFYFWINGNLEKCKGFYIYERTGSQITIELDEDEQVVLKKENPVFTFKNILIGLLTVAAVFLIFANISASKQIEQLKQQQSQLYLQLVSLSQTEQETRQVLEDTEQALATVQEIMAAQEVDIQTMKEALIEAGILEEPVTEPETDGDTAERETPTDEGETQPAGGNSADA